MLRVLRYAILCTVVLFAAGCAMRENFSPQTQLPPEYKLTREQFNEQWEVIKNNYIKPLADTPEVRDACFQHIRTGDLSSCLGDSHARYLTKEELEEILEIMEGSYTSVGLVLSEKGIPVSIEEILHDSPAEESGKLNVGDLVIEVNGKDVSKSPHSVVTKEMRGPADTFVTIRVKRAGKRMDPVTLARKDIIVHSVVAKDIGDITYMRMYDFNERAPGEFAYEVAKRLLVRLPDGRFQFDPSIRKFVWDLRHNPGGLVDVVAMMSYFFSSDLDQIILTTKSRKGEKSVYVGNVAMTTSELTPGVFQDVKGVILIDEWTGSAAEIFAEFIHEVTGAPRIGKKSYGKGTVQSFFRLSKKDALFFTIAEYVVGNQKTRIEKNGITPEYEVESATANDADNAAMINLVDPEKDPQLKKAIEIVHGL